MISGKSLERGEGMASGELTFLRNNPFILKLRSLTTLYLLIKQPLLLRMTKNFPCDMMGLIFFDKQKEGILCPKCGS